MQIFLASHSLLSPLDYVSFYFCYLIFCSLCVDIFEVIKYIFVLMLLMQVKVFFNFAKLQQTKHGK